MVHAAGLLSPDFLSAYEGRIPDNAGVLFYPVYLRTYCRWLDDKGRRETWAETCKRVTEYSMDLYSGFASEDDLRAEAEFMFDSLFNLRVLPAGRTLWVGGTEAARKFPESQFNCFTADTELITKSGIKRFDSFSDGDAVEVITRQGGWKKATIKNFGKAKVHRVVLGLNTSRREIYVTANHRWLIRNGEGDYHYTEKETMSLKAGDLIPVVRTGAKRADGVKPCSIAIQHGLVYGDGTYVKDRNYCLIDLVDESQQFVSRFTTGHRQEEGSRGGVITGRHTRINSLPANWKQLPELSMNKEYLLGFLMGWFAADGSARASNADLFSSDINALEWARSAFALLGYYVSPVRIARENSPFDDTPAPLYKISIPVGEMPEGFLLKDSHSFPAGEPRKNWKVISVTETDRIEDVWCVQEPETQTFALADGILTRNCSFTVIDSLEAFGDVFHMLLCGSGVGFRVLKSDVAQLPRLRHGISIRHLEYHPVVPASRLQCTDLSMMINPQNLKQVARITVGDSKEAWVQSLRYYWWCLQQDGVDEIEFDYDNVRPQGERIRTFGGRAAGPQGLWEMYKDLEKIINRCEGTVGPVDAVDICNVIALNVVVGGNRRSSQIALGSADDTHFIEMKKGLWTDPEKKDLRWRVMSNNSVTFTSKPSRQQLEDIFEGILQNGEPGFFNLEAARKRRPWAEGLNPCAEILLDNRGVCNLSTLVLISFIDRENKCFDNDKLEKAVRLATRIGLRQTNVELSLPKWSAIQKRDRLTGVSMTGIMDAFDAVGWEFDSPQAQLLLGFLNACANDEARRYAFEMRVPTPLLVTAIKPEGTISQLPTCSSGLHRSYAPYYIRRIRVSSIDPVCKALKYIGVPNEPCKSKSDRTVFSFPIKTGALSAAADEPAVRQLKRYYTMQRNYTDHNSSCTLYVSREEAPAMIEEIEQNWDDTVAIALLPKFVGDAYPQMPYEEISEEVFNVMSAMMPDMSQLPEVVNKFELGELIEDEIEQDPLCAGGVCPVR